MIDLDQDLSEARAIIEGRTMLLPELRHLRALQNHHDDTLIQIALKVAALHDVVMSTQ